MIKYTLIHPSKGRPEKAIQTYKNWMKKAIDKESIEWILSVDNSDSKKTGYESEYNKLLIDGGIYTNNTLLCFSDSDCVVKAANTGAEQANGKILIYLSDDFDCPDGWDLLLDYEIKSIYDSWPNKKEFLIKVDDGLQPFDNVVLTIPIMSKELYNSFGYFWHPEYKSIWCDVDLWYTCKMKDVLIEAPKLLFKHLHHSTGATTNDQTYKLSEANYSQGLEVIKERAKKEEWRQIDNLDWLNFAIKQSLKIKK